MPRRRGVTPPGSVATSRLPFQREGSRTRLGPTMAIDVDAAFESYETRFVQQFGDKPVGAFGKFGSTMVQRLSREEFEPRLL